MVYEMLTCEPPFYGLNEQEMVHAIGRGVRLPSYLSADCQDFIIQTLTLDGELRTTGESNRASF